MICIDGALSQVENKVHPFIHCQKSSFHALPIAKFPVFELYNQII